uniref:GATA-type domain-containing protein n=1 Tax=Mycena chlorophos TaxID=658473 RepID=A0ABQ0MCU9_MYCCL|nr:predicted protein [Mycena chlorophos]
MTHSLRTSLSQADIARLLFGPAYEETATGLNASLATRDDPPAPAPAAAAIEPRPASRRLWVNFADDPPAQAAAARSDVCPTCLTTAPTSWRYGKISQSMVCQPCSVYERRKGTQRTPEMAAVKKGDGRR